jgi:hypothetical protein
MTTVLALAAVRHKHTLMCRHAASFCLYVTEDRKVIAEKVMKNDVIVIAFLPHHAAA